MDCIFFVLFSSFFCPFFVRHPERAWSAQTDPCAVAGADHSVGREGGRQPPGNRRAQHMVYADLQAETSLVRDLHAHSGTQIHWRKFTNLSAKPITKIAIDPVGVPTFAT